MISDILMTHWTHAAQSYMADRAQHYGGHIYSAEVFDAYMDDLINFGLFNGVNDFNFFKRNTADLILPTLRIDARSQHWQTRIPAESFANSYKRELKAPTGSKNLQYPFWLGLRMK